MAVSPEEALELGIAKYLINQYLPHWPDLNLKPHPVIMPECADFLLSQIDTSKFNNDEVTDLFNEYFYRAGHKIFEGSTDTDDKKKIIYDALVYDCVRRTKPPDPNRGTILAPPEPEVEVEKKPANQQAQDDGTILAPPEPEVEVEKKPANQQAQEPRPQIYYPRNLDELTRVGSLSALFMFNTNG